MSEKFKLPEKVTKKVYLYLNTNTCLNDNLTVSDADFRGSSFQSEYVFIAEKEVSFDIAPVDVRSEIVKSLEKQKEEIRAEAHMKIQSVQHKIDNLLQIEYKAVKV